MRKLNVVSLSMSGNSPFEISNYRFKLWRVVVPADHFLRSVNGPERKKDCNLLLRAAIVVTPTPSARPALRVALQTLRRDFPA